MAADFEQLKTIKGCRTKYSGINVESESAGVDSGWSRLIQLLTGRFKFLQTFWCKDETRSLFMTFHFGVDLQRYRMTYCLELPAKKMLLMPVEPFEANKSCYVCSETPLLLESYTHRSKLRDFVERVVKAKLGMSLPLIMHGSALLYEVGDDLEADMATNYAANLEKVLSELPSPVTGGTILTVKDLQQELSCNINTKHRYARSSASLIMGAMLSF